MGIKKSVFAYCADRMIAKFNDQGRIQKLQSLSVKEMIEFVLFEEYGSVLDVIKEQDQWEIKRIPISDIRGQEEYMTRLNKATVKEYEKVNKNDLPLGVYIELGNDQYRIIDGYHRLQSQKNKGEKTIKAIVGLKL